MLIILTYVDFTCAFQFRSDSRLAVASTQSDHAQPDHRLFPTVEHKRSRATHGSTHESAGSGEEQHRRVLLQLFGSHTCTVYGRRKDG